MGRTGTVEYKAFLKVAKMFVFTLYSAKTQRLDQCLFVLFLTNLERLFAEFLRKSRFFVPNDSILFFKTRKGAGVCIFGNDGSECAGRRPYWC